MSLDLFSSLLRNDKANTLVKSFIKELSEFVEKKMLNEEKTILEQAMENRKVTIASENKITFKESDIIKLYAEKTKEKGEMYFIKKEKSQDIYNVLKIKNNKIEKITLNKKDLPANVKVNDVLREKNSEYVLDKESTEELKEEILDMANEIIESQEKELNTYRKENHLYIVTDEINNSRFLRDITEKSKYEFEEIKFSKEVLDKAMQGTVLKYENGQYEYYSNDGFEMLGID